jgi:two-component system, chemotaxis family, chemotaxis protein CheY
MQRILVVEDSASTRALVCGILRKLEGCEVDEAPSGLEALRLLARSSYQLVVTDINMPDIHGLEVVRTVRRSANHKDIPVLVVSTQSASRDVERALALGATAYLPKPFTPEVLAQHVRTLLGVTQ